MTGTNLPDPAAALEIAAQIGFGIARRAFWSGARCTWLEAVPVMPGQNPAVSALCGPDVYGGAAGIGWFLAEAAARTGDRLLRRTAEAALRQAAARAAAAPPHGFHGGQAGIGAALILGGRSLADAELEATGTALLSALPAEAAAADQTDFISGLAGSVAALVLAFDATGDKAFLEKAEAAAASLVGMAVPGPEGALSWPSMPGTSANLTGFAHGTAGIAHALLMLDAFAPDRVRRDAAAAAFAYEDAAFDAQQGGWPDYRELPGTPPGQFFYPVAWCHGAAGIAHGRLAAAALGFDVAAALAAGMQAIQGEGTRLLGVPEIDFTLCHGFLGLADALLDASRGGRHEGDALLAAIVRRGVADYHEPERPWPSGLLTHEEICGLMLGNAGIGWLFLRLADPALHSVLVPRIGPRP
jgi:lantibiotic modifying enzyme